MKKVILFVSDKKIRFDAFQKRLKAYPEFEMILFDTQKFSTVETTAEALREQLSMVRPTLVLLENKLHKDYSGFSLVKTIKESDTLFASYSGYDDVHAEFKAVGSIGAVRKVPPDAPLVFEETFKELLQIVTSIQ